MTRKIERSSRFKKDFERESNGRYRGTLATDFAAVLHALANDWPLWKNLREHELAGNWAGYRECHLKPDLLLIYRKSGADSLTLARLGSHSELFG